MQYGESDQRAIQPSHIGTATENPEALLRRHFDTDFYLSQRPFGDKNFTDPLTHYCAEGWKKGLDPMPSFSTSYYLHENADVAAAGINPFLHYLQWGWQEGRKPNARVPKLPEGSESSLFMAIMRAEFDGDLYRSQAVSRYPELADAACDPFRHFCEIGWRVGIDPSASFSTAWYLENNPDVRSSGVNPFHHYLAWGRREGRLPSPIRGARPRAVDLTMVESAVRQAFDLEFYRRNTPAITALGLDPLKHFCAFGWRQECDPSPFFSTAWYLENNPDVRGSGVNPLYHYLVWGRREGRQPGPAGTPVLRRESPDAVEELIRPAFDEAFYRASNPDLADLPIDPLKHYCAFGWRERRDPRPDFSTAFYLETDPSLEKAGINPFHHYLSLGQAAGRLPHPVGKVVTAADLWRHPIIRTVVAEEFDDAYYSACYADIRKNGLDPLEHYLAFGHKEGRDPAAWFSTSYYLEQHPDVRALGINPFFHYLLWGRSIGFQPFQPRVNARQLRVNPKAKLCTSHGLLSMIAKADSVPPPSPNTPFNPAALTIHWVIPDFTKGGGGHMTIFRMVRWLEFFGHRCVIWVNNADKNRTEAQRYDEIIKHYQTIGADIRTVSDDLHQTTGDIIVSTGWDTVYVAAQAKGFKEHFYFVQDFEPWFSSRGALSLAAEGTYHQQVSCICAGPWLEQIMREQYGRWARKFWLAFDTTVYCGHELERPANPIPRIAFYSRIGTTRRLVEFGLLALQILAERGVAFHVDLYGGTEEYREAPFPCTNHGVLDAHELAELYRQTDIGVCFSSTNYSLVPQEMMACGLPVVEVDTESTRAIFENDTVTLCAPHPVAIADQIEALLADPQRRRTQATAAAEWVSRFSWEQSARMVEAAFVERIAERGFPRLPATPVAEQPARPPKASVMIPTWNAGPLFHEVLASVQQQRTPWPFEILVIDSGSTDGTAEFARDAGVMFHAIPQREFGHGRTRNLGVEMSNGDFVAFITQDAKPFDEFWLYNLVTVLEHFPKGAGAFGRHVAWPNASPFVKRDMDRHFQMFGNNPLQVSKYDDLERWNTQDLDFRRFLHFYSDNNSCLRRSVWKDIPLPDVEFGEDQVWADRIIREGYSKIYVPSAVVYHSHDYNPTETMERSKTEALFFKKYFGYDTAPLNAEGDIRYLNLEDERYGIRHGVSEQIIKERQELNAASVMGRVMASMSSQE
ncbi:glycosyltransferase [Roseomonas genomospecies 6]|uniref:Glycosyltransferase n=1 Tax=Roseomonas genomospecies 6 TaxID=214106 RepID=A0A9W7KR82_9PROT|nr:glycosyltransferase [Roseomonas genomospecies 6]